MRTFLLVTIGVFCLLLPTGREVRCENSSWTITVNASDPSLPYYPARLDLPDSLWSPDRGLLANERTKTILPFQVLEEAGIKGVYFLVPGTENLNTLEPHRGEGMLPTDRVRVTDDGSGKITIHVNDEFLTAYHYGTEWRKPFLHPVLSPSGRRLTRAWPMEELEGENSRDHVHQKALYAAYGDVNGVDFWHEGEGSGIQRTDEIVEASSGPVFGRILARNTWVSNEGNPVVSEEREYRFYAAPKDSPVRIVDSRVTFIANHGEVRFGDTKEGGIAAIRMNPSINANRDGTIRNSLGGTGEGECWAKRAGWCDYYGPIDGETWGVAILDHPDNLRHPTWWHVRNYGLNAANCFGISFFEKDSGVRGDHVLPDGESLTFRYRFVIHPDTSEEAAIAEHFTRYSEPLPLTLSEN